MKVALLCPGPSLNDWIAHPPAADITIAINAAAALMPCDWWAVGDAEVISWWPKVKPARGLFHQDTYWQRFAPDGPWDDLHDRANVHWDDVRCRLPFNGMVWHSTMPAAIGLAYALGATHVDAYGADWSGGTYASDIEGRHGPADQRPGRWAQEISDTTATVEAAGITFSRHFSKGQTWTP